MASDLTSRRASGPPCVPGPAPARPAGPSPALEPAPQHVVFKDLPERVRTELKAFEEALDRLHAVVEEELGRQKPGRTPRDLERSPVTTRRSGGRR
jgi:hypothetical protein